MILAPGNPLAADLLFDPVAGPIPAGRLAMADRIAQLEWSPEVLKRKFELSPLRYPPEPGLHPARSREFDGLHGFLADSLPDGWGQLVLRRRLSRLGFSIDDLGPLDRLALVGDQGRGALTFRPAASPPPEVETLDLDTLAAGAMAMLLGEEGALSATLATLGGGSGGARPKIHVGFDPDGAISVSEGETAVGHTAWIVKFRAVEDPIDIGPIEAAYAAMAGEAGVAMAPHRLIAGARGPGYFAARRFDRLDDGGRLHMVSLSGVLEADWRLPGSYDTFLRVVQAVTRRADDVAQAFQRLLFNVLARNRDDHTRQHAFLMDAAGEWRLAPAYDLTCSAGPGGEHYLDIEGEAAHPRRTHVLALGERLGLSGRQMASAIDQVRYAVDRWSSHAANAGVGAASRKEVQQALRRVATEFSN